MYFFNYKDAFCKSLVYLNMTFVVCTQKKQVGESKSPTTDAARLICVENVNHRRADLLRGGHGVHGGGVRPSHGHHPRVLLPPGAAGAPAPPRRQRRQRGERLIHRRAPRIPDAVAVLGDQGGSEPAHAYPGRRVGVRRRPCQLRRAGTSSTAAAFRWIQRRHGGCGRRRARAPLWAA